MTGTGVWEDSTVYLDDICFIDTHHGWAGGSRGWRDGFVLRTTDGGMTWDQIGDSQFPIGIHFSFTDTLNGWMTCSYGGNLFRTTDGGLSWTQITQYLYKVSFVNAQTGWGINGSNILKTTDGGSTWTGQAPENESFLTDIEFCNLQTGMAVGENGTVLRTTDGGTNWQVVHSGPTSIFLNAVSIITGNNDIYAYAVGESGLFIYTADGGANWLTFSHDESDQAWFNGVSFFSPNAGWAVGAHGDYPQHGFIFKYSPYGWTPQRTSWTEPFYDVAAVDSLTAYAAGGGGGIFITTDGGDNWMPQFAGVTWDFGRIKFIDHDLGFAMGGDILSTTNGGMTWVQHILPHDSFTYPMPLDMDFVDAMNGWVVGIGAYGEDCGDGYIIHTTDGGNNWSEQYTCGDSCLNACDFVDAMTGWVVGTNGLVLKTSDGGASWIPQYTGVLWELSAVSFPDPLHGYVISGGSYLFTSDGGVNWYAGSTPASNYLSQIMFLDATHGWAVGGIGTILSYHGLPESVNPSSSAQPPESYSLFAYPNPFNPVATLEFNLSTAGKVRLGIYDITGRLVEMLGNQFYPQGINEIEFNGERLPSGIYFAQMRAGNVTKTTKLVLIR